MTKPSDALTSLRCKPCKGEAASLPQEKIASYLATLPAWELEDGSIVRKFEFKNYYQTIAFVNALAWIAHREDHHPDLEVSYGFCIVRYSTHAVGGLTENDFICAAKVDALML